MAIVEYEQEILVFVCPSFLRGKQWSGRAEQDFCTLARDECADPLLDFLPFFPKNVFLSWILSEDRDSNPHLKSIHATKSAFLKGDI